MMVVSFVVMDVILEGAKVDEMCCQVVRFRCCCRTEFLSLLLVATRSSMLRAERSEVESTHGA